jgi:hypothetical protein
MHFAFALVNDKIHDILFVAVTAQPMNCHSERSEESHMPWTRNIEPGCADLDNDMATLQGFLGWRIEMTAA